MASLPERHPSCVFPVASSCRLSHVHDTATACALVRQRLPCVQQALKMKIGTNFFTSTRLNSIDPNVARRLHLPGAKDSRAVLTDYWSVAAYIPDSRLQFSKEDCETEVIQSIRERERFMAEMRNIFDTENGINRKERCKT